MQNYSRSDRPLDIPGKGYSFAHSIVVSVTSSQEDTGVVEILQNEALPSRTLVFVNGALNNGNYTLNSPADGSISFDSLNEYDEIVVVY